MSIKNYALILAPLLCVPALFWARGSAHPVALSTAVVALLMAAWWLTEALPMGVTALLPVILFPTLGILPGKTVAGLYFNDVIFLFLGGFLVALAMERWNLHRRLALLILRIFGLRPRGLLMGFMVATAFLSMWISNTATTMMMLPIALAVLASFEAQLGEDKIKTYGIGLCLGIAYSASIGGIGTLVGTPPNLAFVKIFSLSFPNAPEINFAQWMIFALPLSVFLLLLLWGFISLFYAPQSIELKDDLIQRETDKLGVITIEEKIVLAHFILLALLWMTRTDITVGAFQWHGWANALFSDPAREIVGADWVRDGSVSVAVGLSLFLFPSRRSESGRLMDWSVAQRMPWQIILLFGGGFALAQGFKDSGLSALIGEQLQGLGALSPVMLVLLVALSMTFLTELTSNTATAQTLLPILAALAVQLQVHPLLLMIPATLAASFAFMLPVATPPNAIVFGSERLTIADMAKPGLLLNLIGVAVVTLLVFLWAPQVFGDLQLAPSWSR